MIDKNDTEERIVQDFYSDFSVFFMVMVKLLVRSFSVVIKKSLESGATGGGGGIGGGRLWAVNKGMHHHDGEVLRLTPENFKILAKIAAEALEFSGGVIAVPTDTVYGLAADAQNNSSIAKLYGIKSRDCLKPIAICVSAIEDVYKWGKVTVPLELLRDFLPGPVTLVFERTAELNPTLNPGTNLVGIRIPDYPFIQLLAELHGGPVALTSANPSAAPSTIAPEEFKTLWPSLKLIFDGGRLSSHTNDDGSNGTDRNLARAGSTVIDLSVKGHFRIIRPGSAFLRCKRILCGKYNLTELIGGQ